MFRLVFLACLAALLVGVQPAIAQGRRAPSGNAQTLDRILPRVRSHYPGTFYDAEGPYPDETGSPHYQLKWMTPEGRVIWLDTDARSGRVVGVRHGYTQRGYRDGYPYGSPPSYRHAPVDAFPVPVPGSNFENGYPRNYRGYYGAPDYGRGNWGGGRVMRPGGWRNYHGRPRG